MKKIVNNDHEQEMVGLGRAAHTAGISTGSLQYYIMCGLIEPDMYTPTGRKRFSTDNIERIKLIKQLNESGYPLREIREIFLKRKIIK